MLKKYAEWEKGSKHIKKEKKKYKAQCQKQGIPYYFKD